jgi:hypothetical protein
MGTVFSQPGRELIGGFEESCHDRSTLTNPAL